MRHGVLGAARHRLASAYDVLVPRKQGSHDFICGAHPERTDDLRNLMRFAYCQSSDSSMTCTDALHANSHFLCDLLLLWHDCRLLAFWMANSTQFRYLSTSLQSVLYHGFVEGNKSTNMLWGLRKSMSIAKLVGSHGAEGTDHHVADCEWMWPKVREATGTSQRPRDTAPGFGMSARNHKSLKVGVH